METEDECRCHVTPYPAQIRQTIESDCNISEVDNVNNAECEERCKRRARNADALHKEMEEEQVKERNNLCLADDVVIQRIRRELQNDKRYQSQLENVMDAYTLHQLRFKCALLEGVSYEKVLADDVHSC